jgi:hypothetical protein
VLKRSFVAILLATSLHSVPAQAAISSSDREALQGIGCVRVLVEHMDARAEQDGFLADTYASDVERRLRQSGICVLSANEPEPESPAPYLYLRVAMMAQDAERRTYAFATAMELFEAMSPQREPSTVLTASAWAGRGVIGAVGRGRQDAIRVQVRAITDQFIQAYMTANRKAVQQ